MITTKEEKECLNLLRNYLQCFLVAIMAMGLFFSVNTKANTVIPVKIQMTGMRGANSTSTQVIAEGEVAFTSGMTAFDAIKAIAISSTDTDTTDVVDGVTYHNQGLLRWRTTGWGNYISAIKVNGHSSTNKFFGTNGSQVSASRGAYFKLNALNDTETEILDYEQNATWNNLVNKENYVSEKDYNKYSGWMVLINGNTNNNGIDTELTSSTTSVVLDFSMMMCLDLGQDSYVQNASGDWVFVEGWQ